MKAIRRSLKGDKESRSPHPSSLTQKSAIAIVPPKKVIKALYDYEPENKNGQELAFHKGDFFHVLSREDDTEWYEACNPLIPSARGLVPVAYFESIGKTQRQSSGSAGSGIDKQEYHDSGYSERGAGVSHGRSESAIAPSQVGHNRMASTSKESGAMVYGIVQYDFNAERPDELEAKAGEAIIVIAQSNPEWFVAKPIGRLGGPGLIPVSFIQIKDMATGQTVQDPFDAVRRAGVPRVEEWKKMAADYKNSSITLGKFDNSQQQMAADMARLSLQNGGSQQSLQSPNSHSSSVYPQVSGVRAPPQQGQMAAPSQPQQPMLLAPISASLPRYCFDNDTYWYIIECQMEDGRHWELSRYYADFYDFQIALLKNFPEEAGNKTKPRTLPFMPGPVAHVTDAISNGRRQNLDEYIRNILSMPPHISKCMLVRRLFAPRHGDFEIDPNAIGEDYRLSGGSRHSNQLQQQMSQSPSRQSSNGQMYPPAQGHSQSAYAGLSHSNSRTAHQRTQGSVSAFSGLPGPNGSNHFLHSQPSTLTQASNSSSVKINNPGGAMKVKVSFQDENIVIRVPQEIPFQALQDKLRDRLKINEDIVIQYKDESTNSSADMRSDEDLDLALQRNPKLALIVNYASAP